MPLLHGNLGGLLGGGENWLIRAEFGNTQAAPLPDPFTIERGIFHPIQNDGQLNTDANSGFLTFAPQTTPVTGDQGFYIEKVSGGALARQSGRVLLAKIKVSTSNFQALGFSRLANCATTNFDIQLYTSGLQAGYGVSNSAAPGLIIPIALNTDYWILAWLLAQGARGLIKGGVYADWTLMFDSTQQATANVYPAFDNTGSAGVMDFVKAKDLPVAYQTDYANIPGLVRVTSSGQSLGANQLTNGDFAAWSSNDPLNWIVVSEAANQTISESASNGSAGTGSAHFEKTTGLSSVPSITQVVGSAGQLVQLKFDITANAGGSSVYWDETGGQNEVRSGTGTKKALFRKTNGNLRFGAYSTANADFVIDNIVYQVVTRNTPITSPVNALSRVLFTLPGSPVAGERICLIERLAAVGDEFNNCFSLEYIRNDSNSNWDLVFCRYSSGTRTVINTTTGVGNKSGLAVTTRANLHQIFARDSATGIWNQAGSGFTDSNFNTATLTNEVHTDGFAVISEIMAEPIDTGWNAVVASLGV